MPLNDKLSMTANADRTRSLFGSLLPERNHSLFAGLNAAGVWPLLASALAVAGVALILDRVAIASDVVRPITFDDSLHVSLMFASSVIASTAAFIMTSLADTTGRIQFRWGAFGLLSFASLSFVMGFLFPLLDVEIGLNAELTIGIFLWSIVCGSFCLGLSTAELPRMSQGSLITAVIIGIAGTIVAIVGVGQFPHFADGTSFATTYESSSPPVHMVNGWYRLASLLPAALAIGALVALSRLRLRHLSQGWLTIALIALTAFQFHKTVWPSTFTHGSPASGVLLLVFGLVTIFGSHMDLRAIARSRVRVPASTVMPGPPVAEQRDRTAIVAHELTTPVAAIGAYAQMLSVEGLNSNERAEALSAIQTQVGVLYDLIQDVRTVTALELDPLGVDLEPTSLREILAEADSFAKTLHGHHSITVDSLDLMVWADAGRVGQLLRNLLSNAAKYSPEGSKIHVSATRHGERVRISVADHGVGIHPDDVSTILVKYHRGRLKEQQATTGHGLGLYLADQIARSHHSRLTVESTVGVGSTFSFELETVE